jgi:hypothetical protein
MEPCAPASARRRLRGSGGRTAAPLTTTACGARFGDSVRVALVLALVAVAASCRHNEQRAARATPERAGLAFTRYASANALSVWLADGDGSRARRFVSGAYSPKLSPDSLAPAGDAVAYGRRNGGAGRAYRSDIFVISLRTASRA